MAAGPTGGGAGVSYHSNVNPDLLAAVPVTARRVLEVGCGTGALGEAFRRRVPGVRWTGVEIDAAAAAAAKAHLDTVIAADINGPEIPWDDWLDGFDAVVLGDVLEHLADPWAVLARLVRCLAPGGTVCACIPNIGHWSVIAGLLAGHFRYAESGLLDRTHLRFFTAESIQALFAGVGLAIRRMRGRALALDAAGFARFMAAAAPMLGALGEDAAAAKRRLETLQYVVAATPAADTTPPRPRLVVAMLAMAPRLAEVRVRLPLEALRSLPDVEVHYFETAAELPRYPADQPRVLIVQRQIPKSEDSWRDQVAALRSAGWAVIAEWDDHPDLFAPAVRASFDRAPWASVRLADAVQTSTETLAAVIREQRGDDSVAVMDNRLLALPQIQPREDATVRMLFAALNRGREGAALMAALSPVLRRHPGAEVVVVHDRAVFDALDAPNKRFSERLSYDAYHALIGECDIALLPLDDTAANACKSDIKWVECAAHRVACIASPTVYSASIADGVTGLIADDPQGFAAAAERLITDAPLRAAIGAAARTAVGRDHLLGADIERRVDWYLSVWRRRRI